MDFLGLPVVMIENVFSYLSYDEIAKNRLVSRAFNEVSMRMLNRGFMMIERRHAMALKNVKAQLPRRESERRVELKKPTLTSDLTLNLVTKYFYKWYYASYDLHSSLESFLAELDDPQEPGYHHLSRHCDILTSIETRISMLNMTYSKFIDNGLCCFIPGKVIDEIKRVLAIVETTTTPPRAHEVLQELRDISSMAIEHFDDKISPAFRKKLQQGAVQPVARASNAVLAPLAMRQEMAHLRRRSILNAKLSLFLASQYKAFCKQSLENKKTVARQQKMIREMTQKQREQENVLEEMKKRVEEFDIRHNELFHTNQVAGGKAIAANAAVDVAPPAPQPLRHFSSQIKLDLSVLPIGTSKRNNKLLPNMKPRKPVIKMPSLSEDDSEPPPKLQKMDESRFSPAPSTSREKQSPTAKTLSAMAKIISITKEIRSLSNQTKNYDNQLKRHLEMAGAELHVPDNKKQKLD